MDIVHVLSLWLAIAVASVLAALWFLWRIWKRYPELGLRTRVAASALIAVALYGGVGTVSGLAAAFSGVGGVSVDPSQRAVILAQGISEAMTCTALSLIVFTPSVIALLFLTRKRAPTPASGSLQ